MSIDLDTRMNTRDGMVPMDSPQRCALTELIKDQCAHCRPIPPAFQEAAFATPDSGAAAFPARYSGRCEQCDGVFEVGDWISRIAPGDYLCSDCAHE